MELFELYGIIGNAIMFLVEILICYFLLKLFYKVIFVFYDENSRFNKLCESLSKREHFRKHYKKWLRREDLRAKYNDFYDYYNEQYCKRYKLDIACQTHKEYLKNNYYGEDYEKQSIE